MPPEEPQRQDTRRRGRATLVARFAFLTFLVVASLTMGNLAILGWVFQAELDRSLEQNLRGAVTGFQATVERQGAVLDAATRALANLPLLKAAMGSNLVDAESLQAIADEQREALGVDLLVLVNSQGEGRATSPALKSHPVVQHAFHSQMRVLEGALYLTTASEVQVDGRRIGFALAGKRVDSALLEAARASLGVEVVLYSGSDVKAASLPPERLTELQSLPQLEQGHGLHLQGDAYLAHAVPLGGEVTGLVLLNTDSARSRLRWTLLMLGLAGGLLALGIGLAGVMVVRRELRPLQALTEAATRVVEEDDFRHQLQTGGKGEIRELEQAFQQMISKLGVVLRQLKHAGTEIGGVVSQMRSSSQMQEEGALRQAAAIHQTSSTTEELARSSALVANNAKAVAEIAARTLDAADAGKQTSAALHQSVQLALQEQKAVAEASSALFANIKKIGRVVEFIGAIADRTDLLALNAELEGTKAGPAGAGFTLVAGEMRRLAENVSQSTRQIEQQMEAIREATEVMVKTGEGARLASERWGALASDSSMQLEKIVAHARETRSAVDGITVSVDQQQLGTSELAQSMSEVSRDTERGLEATRQVTHAGQQLSELAKELREVVDRFKVA